VIYVVGDSWGFSYADNPQALPSDKDSQIFCGQSLADSLTAIYDCEVTNLCERGLTNFQIAKKIELISPLLSEGDIFFVLQTDPLRSAIIPWRRKSKTTVLQEGMYDLSIPTPMSIIDICDNFFLKDFYSKLSKLQNQFKIQIILHGGCSRLNYSLAESFNLSCTDKTSTEIIVNDFEDTYFFSERYFATNIHALRNYKNFNSNYNLVASILKTLEKKHYVWQKNPELFTYNHTTEKGTRLVSEYISKFLDIDKYKQIRSQSCE